MPKLLVLFHSRTGRTAALADAIADAIADGARSVRFAEVDVRRLDDGRDAEGGDRDGSRRRHRALADEGSLADYDGIILGASAQEGSIPSEIIGLLERLEPLRRTGALVNKVGAAFVPAGSAEEPALWSLLGAMGRLGTILVPPLPTSGSSGPDAELAAATDLGRRVATVVEWVTHAKHHAHGHSHGHPH
jgi:multimeric flavodoxin WrbA